MIPAITIAGDGTVATTARLQSVTDPGGIADTAGAFSNQGKSSFPLSITPGKKGF
jgi:hypothetical protein